MLKYLLRVKRKIKKLLLPSPEIEKKEKGNKFFEIFYKLFLAFSTVVLLVFVFPLSSFYQPLGMPEEGEFAQEDVVAPFEFPLLKSGEELEKDQKEILSFVPIVLIQQKNVSDSILSSLGAFFKKIDNLNPASLEKAEIKKRFPILSHLNDDSWEVLKDTSQANLLKKSLLPILRSFYSQGIFEKLEDLPFKETSKVAILKNKAEIVLAKDSVLDLTKAKENLYSSLNQFFSGNNALINLSYEIGINFLLANLKLDSEETEKRREKALSTISLDKGLVLKGEKIIRQGQKVTSKELDKLSSLVSFRIKTGLKSGFLSGFMPVVERLVFVFFLILALGLFLYFLKREFFESNTKLSLIALVLWIEIIMAYLLLTRTHLSFYLLPLTIGPMLLTILLDLEVGLTFTFILSASFGVLTGFNFELAFLTVVSGTLACFSVKEVRNRLRFYRPVLYISFSYIVFIFLVQSLKLTSSNQILQFCGFGLLNGFISPALTLGLLPIFESVFDITTDITLLELSDQNHPLMKRLALAAPGTYHHSIVVGNLAEAASKAIGANSLLARVGALYHDIGKVEKPEYFVENQMGAKSRHEKLTPSMSALILESHVKEGVEFAEAEALPERIIDFIREHHGTSLMTYFYSKALEKGATEEEESEYHYPGPKPESKESAIVMLADGVEAASRVLHEPKPARIIAVIKKVINTKLEAGELEESKLTLKELHLIEESFLPVLLGVFHPRIEYPELGEEA